MKTMLFRILPFCVIVGFAMPAGSAPRLKEAPVPVYYPATVGDRWVMETKSAADAMEVSATITEMVTAVEKKDGAVIVTVCREVDGKLQETKSQMKITDQGLFRISTYGTVYAEPYLVLKTPLKIGEAWTAEVSKGSTFKYKVTKEEEIEVPAGKFKTLRLEVDLGSAGNARASIWYAPRVGVVKQEYKSDIVNYVKTLKEFKAGK
jgi:hypothetical protein